MEEIATLLLNYGILGVIALFYFKNNKEDREEKKEMHEKQTEQTERVITVIENNSNLIRETRAIHTNMDNTIKEMQADIEYIKTQLDKNDDVLLVLNNLEDNLKELIERVTKK